MLLNFSGLFNVRFVHVTKESDQKFEPVVELSRNALGQVILQQMGQAAYKDYFGSTCYWDHDPGCQCTAAYAY
jgi:hypothetical protein